MTTTTIVTRRARAGGLAGVAAAAPAPGKPDAALFALGRRFDAQCTIVDARAAQACAASRALRAVRDAAPAALRWTWARDKRMPFTLHLSPLRDGMVYPDDVVGMIRARVWDDGRGVTYTSGVPAAEVQARAAEIVAAFDRFNAESGVAGHELTLEEANEALGDALERRCQLEEQIIAARAATLEGLAVKARVALHIRRVEFSDGEHDDFERPEWWTRVACDLAETAARLAGGRPQ